MSFEAEFARHRLAVDRERRAGQRSGAQRQVIDPAAAVGKARAVAAQHLEIRQQMVAEGHRLRHLQVREAGQGCVDVGFGRIEQGFLQIAQQAVDVVDRVAQPEPDVGSNLVIARAAGMQALAGIADQRREAFLDVEMDVLVVEVPVEAAGLDLAGDRGHALFDGGQVGGGDDALASQHARMCQRSPDVLAPHAAIKRYGRGVTLDQVGNGFVKAPRPRCRGCWRCRRFWFCHNRAAMNQALLATKTLENQR